jgi:hypothetical protein
MTWMRPQIVAAASISPVEPGAVGPTGVRGTCPAPHPRAFRLRARPVNDDASEARRLAWYRGQLLGARGRSGSCPLLPIGSGPGRGVDKAARAG